MLDPKLRSSAELYGAVINEITSRILAYESAMERGRAIVPEHILNEFGALQLRMICELIALGCLVAHGDVTENNRRLLDKWHAGEIVKAMEKLHPNFFPKSVKLTTSRRGSREADLRVEPKSGFLTKEELVTLYGKCGDMLHRGTVNGLTKKKARMTSMELGQWHDKIVILLDQHHIASANNQWHYFCWLRTLESGGKASVVVAHAPG